MQPVHGAYLTSLYATLQGAATLGLVVNKLQDSILTTCEADLQKPVDIQ